MNMRLIKIILVLSLLLYRGVVNAEPVINVTEAPQNQNTVAQQPPQDSQKNDAQTQIEQAADHFDAFALQMPKVIALKLDAFRKHGFRAIFLDDPDTKPAEEAMIDSLMKGLQALGNSLAEDLSRTSAKTQEEKPAKKPPQKP